MKIFKVLLVLGLGIAATVSQAACVVLLHGLARSSDSMQQLAFELESQGFVVVNVDYPSREHTIDILAELAIAPALSRCRPERQIHFVTHSMGGILVRQYLSLHKIENLGRVVMLGPPNNGSEVVDVLADTPGFYLLNGPAGMQLGTEAGSVPNILGPADFDLGVIAGTSSINWILSSMIPGVDDGKVSVASSKLQGMRDHIEMSVTHPLMMSDEEVIAQVLAYLREGRFDHRPREEGFPFSGG